MIMKVAVFGLLRSVIWQKFTDVSEMLSASIIKAIALITTQKTAILIIAAVRT
jgi:hypothetical protein